MTRRPTICLNMIVRNEAHVVGEVLDAVAPHIHSYVIVDTGSDDGTQDVIRGRMAGLGIPGELHERPWRDFGHNRSEALALAQGRGDYVWVIDADDMLRGTPDFSDLSADVYQLHYHRPAFGIAYWRRQLFRDGVPWRYAGVVHEYAVCDRPVSEERLGGEYTIESRRLGARNQDSRKYERDRDLLLAEVKRDPDDARSVFYLAQSYSELGDLENARRWYVRRIELGGWGEEVFIAMFRLAATMERLGAPWPDVQDAYLAAWEYRPTRAEPLYAIACRYRLDQRYLLGYLFAERACAIPFPGNDISFVSADVYAWRAADEQAVCASWIGRHAEALALYRRLLARSDLPVQDRRRIAANRDKAAAAVITQQNHSEAPLPRPPVRAADVTLTMIAGPNIAVAERMLASFLSCCTDVERVGRFLILDAGLSAADRAGLSQRYGFVEFGRCDTKAGIAPIRALIDGPRWLHLGQGWQFFAPEKFVDRMCAVLDAEPSVFQVGVNFADAVGLTGAIPAEDAVRRAADGGRYVFSDKVSYGPAMFDTARLDRAARDGGDTGGWRIASLDEVLCVRASQN